MQQADKLANAVLGETFLLLAFGIWKHMFAKRCPVSVILPGTVRKAECGWTKSDEEAEEKKIIIKKNKGYLQHTHSFICCSTLSGLLLVTQM